VRLDLQSLLRRIFPGKAGLLADIAVIGLQVSFAGLADVGRSYVIGQSYSLRCR
jgi:hypothetical protein